MHQLPYFSVGWIDTAGNSTLKLVKRPSLKVLFFEIAKIECRKKRSKKFIDVCLETDNFCPAS